MGAEGMGMATDGQGNVYVSGGFSGTVNFGSPNSTPYYLSSGNNWSNFAASYSPSGILRWAMLLGPLGPPYGGRAGIAVQGTNVYVDYGGNNVAKLDATAGSLIWTVPIPASDGSEMEVAVGPSTGNVYATGRTSSSQAFVAQLNDSGTSGVLHWTQRTSTTSGGTAEALGVAVYDTPNNGPESVYVTGDYLGTVTFGATPQTSLSGSSDLFVWKLNADSTSAGVKSLGTGGYDQGKGIAVDGAGNVCVTGQWNGNTNGLVNDYTQIFVGKLTPTLTLSWADYLSKGNHTNYGMGFAVAVDGAGNIYTTGAFSGSVDFDPGSGQYILQSGTNGSDIFVSELNSSGNFVAAADMHGTSYLISRGYAIAVDNSSPGSPNVYTTGQLRGTADFDPTSGTYYVTADSTGTPYIFVSKLTQPSSALLATPASTPLADATTSDQSVAPPRVAGNVSDLALTRLFAPGSVSDVAPFVGDGGSRGPTESQLVTQGVLGIGLTSVNPTTTPQAAWPPSPATVALDWLFADLVGGALPDAHAADALLAPPA